LKCQISKSFLKKTKDWSNFHYLVIGFFGANLQIYLFEHPWDEATYIVHQNGLKND
jgi:hypothetical protein